MRIDALLVGDRHEPWTGDDSDYRHQNAGHELVHEPKKSELYADHFTVKAFYLPQLRQ